MPDTDTDTDTDTDIDTDIDTDKHVNVIGNHTYSYYESFACFQC